MNQEVKQKQSSSLKPFQQLHLDVYKAQQEIANLSQKLYHARRNLEEEKRRRRAVEQQRDLLESHIVMVQNILFHNEETKLDVAIKEKLQFINKINIKNKCNNLCIQNMQKNGQLNSKMEMNTTGSILSDLNCLSKSDDSDINTIIEQTQRQREWRKHKPSCEYLENKQYSTLDKVAEFNLLEKISTATVKSSNSTNIASLQTQTRPTNETADSKMNTKGSSANHIFSSKIILRPETCTVCDKRVRFGKTVLTCKDCSVMCHTECKHKITRSCINK